MCRATYHHEAPHIRPFPEEESKPRNPLYSPHAQEYVAPPCPDDFLRCSEVDFNDVSDPVEWVEPTVDGEDSNIGDNETTEEAARLNLVDERGRPGKKQKKTATKIITLPFPESIPTTVTLAELGYPARCWRSSQARLSMWGTFIRWSNPRLY